MVICEGSLNRLRQLSSLSISILLFPGHLPALQLSLPVHAATQCYHFPFSLPFRQSGCCCLKRGNCFCQIRGQIQEPLLHLHGLSQQVLTGFILPLLWKPWVLLAFLETSFSPTDSFLLGYPFGFPFCLHFYFLYMFHLCTC